MVIYGYIWLYMVIYGYNMVIYGYIRLCIYIMDTIPPLPLDPPY